MKDYAKAHYPRSFLHLPRFCPLIHYKESSADYNVNKYYDYTMKKKIKQSYGAHVVTLITVFRNIYQIFRRITLLKHVLIANQYVT